MWPTALVSPSQQFREFSVHGSTYSIVNLNRFPFGRPKRLFCRICPKCLKFKYPTRVIIDATEIYIEKLAVSELQQLTFSSYKFTTLTKV